jgi:hypothetical protein
MIAVPCAIEMNDITLFVGKSLSGADVAQAVMDQFDVLHDEGQRSARAMCLALYPFIINQPFRHTYPGRALDYITQHEAVWLATIDETADSYFATAYDDAVARQSSGGIAA